MSSCLNMKQIEVKIGKTPAGYSAAIDILLGWVVAVTGSFADIRKEIEDSIAFYIDCAKADGVVNRTRKFLMASSNLSTNLMSKVCFTATTK